MNRRQFLFRTGAAATAASVNVITSSALGNRARAAASDRIVMGAIGVGGMGRHDLGNFLTHEDTQVVAVCDVDSSRLTFAKEMVDKHYENTDCAAYSDFHQLLARDDIDAVLIATPDHWHAYLSIAAAYARKDIYCEKPISLTISEGRIVANAMKELGRVYQSGTQRRSIPCFRYAVDAARAGKVGKIHTIKTYLEKGKEIGPQPEQEVPEGFDYEVWLGQAQWRPYTQKRCHTFFRWIYDYSGGQLTDIGAHFNDLAQWGNDSEMTGPISYEGTARFPKADDLFNTPVDFQLTAKYAGGVTLEIHDKSPRSVTFVGDEGWISVNDDGVLDADPKSLLADFKGDTQTYSFMVPHQRNFLDAVKSRGATIAPPEVAHRSTTVCHAANICLRLGRKLEWDPAAERFKNDDEANSMLEREARVPWGVRA